MFSLACPDANMLWLGLALVGAVGFVAVGLLVAIIVGFVKLIAG